MTETAPNFDADSWSWWIPVSMLARNASALWSFHTSGIILPFSTLCDPAARIDEASACARETGGRIERDEKFETDPLF